VIRQIREMRDRIQGVSPGSPEFPHRPETGIRQRMPDRASVFELNQPQMNRMDTDQRDEETGFCGV
jgi:hypothetical protein